MENKNDSTVLIPITKIELNKGQIAGLPQNPRFIRDERFTALVKSIQDAPEMLRLRELLVVGHEGKFVVIGGNMRLRACRELGLKEIPCKVLPADTPVQKLREYTLKDNNAFGETDWDIIANEWDVDELSDWGVEFPTDFELPGEGGGNHADEDDFDEDTDNVEARTEKGDVWQLGAHRLMCGDATKREDINRLMGGELPDLVLTDPPYGINVVNKDGHIGVGKVAKPGTYMPIKGDETTDTAKDNYVVLRDMGCKKFIIFGGNYFVDFLPFSPSWIIWDKRGDMPRNNFADGEMAWSSSKHPVRIYKQVWNGMIREGEHEKRVHPTQKPVRLLGDIMTDFSAEDEKVLDCFGGSGSTLMACEQIGRKCYCLEYEPHYCDVIIARWEKMTNQKAERIERYERKEPNSV